MPRGSLATTARTQRQTGNHSERAATRRAVTRAAASRANRHGTATEGAPNSIGSTPQINRPSSPNCLRFPSPPPPALESDTPRSLPPRHATAHRLRAVPRAPPVMASTWTARWPAEPQVSAVIFDLDGTLLVIERATRNALNEFLEAYGKVPDKEEEEKRLGQMYRESTTGIIADYGLPLTVEQYAEAIYPLYLKRWQKAKPLTGVEGLVKHLYRNGVPLALASNSVRRNINHKLLTLEDWKDCFSVILGGDQVPHGKPSPDIFLEAAKSLGVNPSSCLVIEDSLQ